MAGTDPSRGWPLTCLERTWPGVRAQDVSPLDVEADVQDVAVLNDVRLPLDALEALISKGYVVDTMEISAPWSRLDAIYEAATAAIQATSAAVGRCSRAANGASTRPATSIRQWMKV